MLTPAPSEIIAENRRRLAGIYAPFDPVSGKGSEGERFPLTLEEAPEGVFLLPVEMKASPIVRLLSRFPSIREAALSYGKSAAIGYDEAFSTLGEMLVRERMRHDFPFWAASFVKIKRKGGGADTAFILNAPQRLLVAELEKMRRSRRPVRMILLKARQWGGSTCVQLYMAWLQLVHQTGLNSLIIAHQGAGSDEIRDMFDRMMLRYPARLLHKLGENYDENEKKLTGVGRSGAIARVAQRNCKIKIGTAERPDSCRGGDYNLVHLSEVGIWKATREKCPEDIVRSACSGVLYRPMTMIIMESTANGTGNFFHQEYLAARRGESQFRAFFISWFQIEQYSLPFGSEEEREEFAKRLVENKDSDAGSGRSQSGRYMWRLWEKGATLEALHWYVAERAKYSDHAAMAAEYPSDDTEAFSHSGMRVFSPDEAEALRRHCMPPLFTGELNSAMKSGFPDLDGITLRNDPSGRLKIWEMPDPEGTPRIADRYLTVMDVGGRGERADWTVVTVFDRLLMPDGEPPSIAAQWRGHGDLDMVVGEAARLAAFYEDSLLVVESNTIETRGARNPSGGDSGAESLPYVMTLLRDNYPNLYARRRSPEEVRDGQPTRYGFHTNTLTKRLVIAELIRAVRERLYIERDDDAIDELLQYEQRPDGSYGAITGCHDDILMTRAIGLYICFHEMQLPRETKRHRSGPSGHSEAVF